jgi:hypothetical protein
VWPQAYMMYRSRHMVDMVVPVSKTMFANTLIVFEEEGCENLRVVLVSKVPKVMQKNI